MLDYSITCIVLGKKFSPSLAIKKLGIELYDNTEPGVRGQRVTNYYN
jgi:hypothetical protein